MKRLTVLVVVVVAVVVSAGAALAAWTIGSIGASGRGAARTLPTGPTPTATAGGSTVTVSFTQVSLGASVLGSLTGGGYAVKRYSSGGAAQTVGAACNATISGSAATLSCAESSVPAGTWSYKVTPVLSGWTGIEGTAGTVTAAASPAPSTPALTAASDTGSSSTDGITKVTTPTVSGTAQAGSTVTIYDGTTAVGTGTATGGGAYSVTTSTLAQGSHSLTAKAANVWGTSPASGTLTVTIDTTAPSVTVTLLASGGGSSKITASGTGSTTDGKVTLYLCHSTPCTAANAAYQNATITVVALAWTDTSGNVGAGTYYAVAQQTDAAGNTGASAAYGPFVR
ncbi:MAG TPA: Ig-like domain-containing protein [Acidimicrobiia bacterium]|nr:Ig-like domain-containing protein [Acidimicrobiia bacterium]